MAATDGSADEALPAVAEEVPLTHNRCSRKLPKLDDPQRDQVDVSRRKRRLTAAEKAAKKRRKAEFQTVFVGGKMKRVRRPPTIEGVDVHEFIRRNADPIFLHEHEMWELMEEPDAPHEPDEIREGMCGKHAARDPELTMIVEPAGDMFLARCPELNIASRGYTAEDARANLAEDVEVFFEAADQSEVPAARAQENVKSKSDEAGEMRPEYDFSGGVRGKYAERYRQQLTAAVEREEDGFVSLCPELDIASQGDTAEEARANLQEALELFSEVADEAEVRRRTHL